LDLYEERHIVRIHAIDLTRVLLGFLLLQRVARADDSAPQAAPGIVTVSTAASEPEPLRGARRIDRTAYTLDQGHVDIGAESIEAAPFDELTLGTYVPTWLLSPVLGAPVPTGFVKARTPFIGPWVASLRANVVYLSGASLRSELAAANSANGSLWIVPVELAVSVNPAPRFNQSLELMYVGISGSGGANGTTTIQGSAAATSLTLSSFSEFRLSSAFALTLLGRVLVHQDAALVQGNASTNGTQVDFNLGVRRRNSFVACIVPGFELDVSKVHLDLGVGYGSYWLPILELALASYGPVPEANLFVRF
jgi:hypothetical protein